MQDERQWTNASALNLVSRIEPGERELELELVACQDLIAEVVDWLRPLAAAKGIGLAAERPAQAIGMFQPIALAKSISPPT